MVFLTPSVQIFSAISCREQFTFDDNDVTPPGHIILIPSHPFFVLSLLLNA